MNKKQIDRKIAAAQNEMEMLRKNQVSVLDQAQN